MLQLVLLLSYVLRVLADVWVDDYFTEGLPHSHGWGHIENLVTFGDSYTDENRLNYFSAHNGSAPPPGTILPASNNTSTGGTIWARYVSRLTDTTLYDYAVAGATCSNALFARFLSSIHQDFPSVKEYEVPAFAADQRIFQLDLSKTIFSIWIGTNDLGVELSHSQKPGVGLTNFTDCVFDVLQELYDLGGRNFIVQNIAPLQFTPLYADAAHGGTPGPNRFWTTKGTNLTEISEDMRDLVQATNQIWKFQAPYELHHRLRGAKLAVFDSYGIMLDIYNNPATYLKGPDYNLTGFINHCDFNRTVCTQYRNDSRDSFFWYDELHPSEQVDRVIAGRFASLITGKPNNFPE